MKHDYLFPTYFKKIGWILLVPSLVLSVYWFWYGFNLNESLSLKLEMSVFALMSDEGGCRIIQDCMLEEVSLIGLILSLLFISFAKERDEDECIAKIRGASLVWALFAAYAFMILETLFIYGLAYLNFMIFNMVAVLILFCIKFNYAVYQFRKSVNDEE